MKVSIQIWVVFATILMMLSYNCFRQGVSKRDLKVDSESEEERSSRTSSFQKLPQVSIGDLRFFVDFHDYWDEETYHLLMYYAFNYDQLIFVREAENYRARFEVSVQYFDQDNNILLSRQWDKEFVVDDYEKTLSRELQFIGNENLSISKDEVSSESARYKLQVMIKDLQSARMAMVEVNDLEISPFEVSPVTITEFGFASFAGRDTSGAGIVRNGKNILVQPNRIFDSRNQKLVVFYSIHNPTMNAYQVRYSITNSWNKEMLPDSLQIDAVLDFQIKEFNIEKFSDDQYTFSLRVYQDSITGAQLERNFRILGNIFDLSKHLKETLKLVSQYIGDGNRLKKKLKNKNLTLEDREQIWNEFWKKKDPSPGTPENEYLEEFVRRIRYANEHFSSGLLKGWITDMGRIYICLGPPDEVYRYPFPRSSRPYEIWEYYGRGAVFFYDKTGFDDYIIISHSLISFPTQFEFE